MSGRRCGFAAGALCGRVLLVADRDDGRLVVYPAPVLDTMINRHHAEAFVGVA